MLIKVISKEKMDERLVLPNELNAELITADADGFDGQIINDLIIILGAAGSIASIYSVRNDIKAGIQKLINELRKKRQGTKIIVGDRIFNVNNPDLTEFILELLEEEATSSKNQ